MGGVPPPTPTHPPIHTHKQRERDKVGGGEHRGTINFVSVYYGVYFNLLWMLGTFIQFSNLKTTEPLPKKLRRGVWCFMWEIVTLPNQDQNPSFVENRPKLGPVHFAYFGHRGNLIS